MSSRIGVDIGGTFTDFIIYDEEKNSVTIDKIPTTPNSPEKAVIDVIKRNLDKNLTAWAILRFLRINIGALPLKDQINILISVIFW